MKNSKIIGALSAIIAIGIFLMVPAHRAYAEVSQSDIDGADYVFQDGANIKGTIGGETVDFLDTKSSDSTRNYVPQSSSFCDPGDIKGVKDGGIKNGINIDSGADLTASSVPAKIKLGILQGVTCAGSITYKNIDNPADKAATDFQWNGDNITSLTGSKSQSTFTPAAGISDPLYLSLNKSSCGADGAILLDSAGGNSGTYYAISDSMYSGRGGRPSNLDSYPKLKATNALSNKCYVDSSNPVTIAGSQGTKAPTGGGGTGSVDSGSTPDTCYLNSTWSLAWLACPALEAASTLANALINTFEDQLSFRVSDLNSNNGQQSLKTAWTIFKDLSSALFVIIMLVMVLSEAASFGPFDAYTVRKMLPRLIIAIIIMQLSWALLSWVVNLVDDVGRSLADLMYLPFGGTAKLQFGALLSNAGVNGLGAAAVGWGGLIAGVATAAFAPFSVLMAAFIAIMALLVGLATLIFRKILIMLCLVFAPIALAAWILPGTKKYYDMWYSNFSKSLMMFPLVVALIAAGRIFAYVSGTQESHLLGFIIVCVGYFGPLFLLPKAYRWGGTLMSQAGSGISNAMEKSVGGRTRKWIDGQRAAQKEWKSRDAAERLATGDYQYDSRRFAKFGTFGKSLDKRLNRVMNNGMVATGRKGLDRQLTGTTPISEANRRKYDKIQEQAEAYRAEDMKQETARLTRFLEDYDMGDHDKIRRALMLGETVDVKKLDGTTVPFNGVAEIKKVEDKDGHKLAHLRVEAAAAMAAQMGGEQHMKAIDEWSKRIDSQKITDDMSAEEKAHIEESKVTKQRFLQHSVGQLFGKMPHLYKGIGGAATEPPETIAGMSGTAIESILAELSHNLTRSRGPQESPEDFQKAQNSARKGLDTFLHNLSEAAANENLRGRLNQNGLKAARAFVAKDLNALGADPNSGEIPAPGTVNSGRLFNDGNEQDVPIFKTIHNIDPQAADIPEVIKYRETIERLINPDGSINRSAEHTPISTGSQESGNQLAGNGSNQQPVGNATTTQQQTQGGGGGQFAQGQAGAIHGAQVGEGVTVELHPSEAFTEAMTRAVREGIRTQGEVAGTGEHPETGRIIKPGDEDFHSPSSSDLPRG